MKAKELRELEIDALRAKEKEFREQAFKLRFEHATGQLEKTARLRTIRRDIARVKTVLRQKELSHG